jgi:DNA-binding ferritin-like protein
MKKNWKLESIEDTYKKYMSYVGSAVSSIEMLSALQTIKNNEPPLKSIHDQIKELIKNQDNVLKQQESLESTTNINSFDKQSLRQFYNDKQQKYASQLTELTNSIEVINPNIITVQRSLFHESD